MERQDDGLAALEPIRESIRSTCIQDQFTWEQSWKSVLVDVTQTRRGLILPDVFQQLLELNNVPLSKKALRTLVDQFQGPNGAINAHRFLQWINLSRPNDYVDPELTFARLPQPYRRIVKILEQDILEAAWNLITTTSAKYKAETAAVLSARSARSSVLNLHPTAEEANRGAVDDYDLAKKRCSKTNTTVSLSENADVVDVAEHSTLPLILVGMKKRVDPGSGDNLADVLSLQLIDTASSRILRQQNAQVPTFDATSRELVDVLIVKSTALRTRCVESSDSPGPLATHIVAINVAVALNQTIDGTDVRSEQHAIQIYEFEPASEERPSSSRLIALLRLQDTEDRCTALELSLDASLLTIATSNKETSVYKLPIPSNQTDDTSPLDLSKMQPLRSSLTKTPVAAAYYLNDAVTRSYTNGSIEDQLTRTRPVGLALVTEHEVIKCAFPPLESTITTEMTVCQTWSHLKRITCSSIDPTTQFLSVGLADGTVVVWNVLEERDHAILSEPITGSVDAIVCYREAFIAALSTATQQLSFFDITDRGQPILLRTLSEPTSKAIPQDSTAARTVLVRMSLSMGLPILLVGYSNGYSLLYDMRNGEAMGSIRTTKSTIARDIHTLVTNEGVASVVSSGAGLISMDLYGWDQLLKTSFPATEHILREKRLQVSAENVKRLFLSSVNTNINAPLTISLSFGAPSLKSTLQTIAGERVRFIDSTSSLSMRSTQDSRQTLATVTTTGSTESISLPPLDNVTFHPHLPDFAALYDGFCNDEMRLSQTSDSKLHRRRNELIKILTAAW